MSIAIFSFLGIVIGAALQYFFTRHIEDRRHLRDLRSKAYMDYLQCVCEHAQLRRHQDATEQSKLFARTADAKARVCLYGSHEVILAFSKFEQLGATMNTEEQQASFTQMLVEMRFDSKGKDNVAPKDLEIVLLGFHK